MMRPKHKRPARLLRLEGLEKRSLLAGGIMDFTAIDAFNRDRSNHNQFDHNVTRRDQDRPAQVAEHRLHGGNRDPQNADRPPKTRAESGRERRPEPPRQSELQSQLARPPVAITAPAFSQADLAPTIAPADALPRAETAPNDDVDASTPNRLVPPNADALTTLVDSPAARQPAPEVSPPTSSLVAVTVDSNPTVDVEQSPVAMTEKSIAADQAFSSPDPLGQIESPAADPVVVDTRQTDDLIELTPFLKSSDVDHASASSEEAFHLDLAILSRLRDAIRPTSTDFAEASDEIFRDWLHGPGGMIALSRMDFPSDKIAFNKIMVDVHLESTLTLHRTLELFATSSSSLTNVSLSDAMLDNIMATLGELTESQTQPITEPVPTRLTSLAYPIIGLAVTGAALTARHRFRKGSRSGIDSKCNAITRPKSKTA